jgi:hypothetical protein
MPSELSEAQLRALQRWALGPGNAYHKGVHGLTARALCKRELIAPENGRPYEPMAICRLTLHGRAALSSQKDEGK